MSDSTPSEYEEYDERTRVDELNYTDAQLLGTKLYASDARALLHLILQKLGTQPQTELPLLALEQAIYSAVDSLNLNRDASLSLIAVALLGRPVDASSLFDAAAVLGPERVRTRLEAALLRLTRVAI